LYVFVLFVVLFFIYRYVGHEQEHGRNSHR
jgi:hypothetical protein